mmetsp:Transcript_14349/g.34702  ORF Transcript_14349/g.34702 Transcript_14349/m.34702 type:complete len:210 (-) Transcript_14349:1876-2505(-)
MGVRDGKSNTDWECTRCSSSGCIELLVSLCTYVRRSGRVSTSPHDQIARVGIIGQSQVVGDVHDPFFSNTGVCNNWRDLTCITVPSQTFHARPCNSRSSYLAYATTCLAAATGEFDTRFRSIGDWGEPISVTCHWHHDINNLLYECSEAGDDSCRYLVERNCQPICWKAHYCADRYRQSYADTTKKDEGSRDKCRDRVNINDASSGDEC